jgi:hypothetical protein
LFIEWLLQCEVDSHEQASKVRNLKDLVSVVIVLAWEKEKWEEVAELFVCQACMCLNRKSQARGGVRRNGGGLGERGLVEGLTWFLTLVLITL